MIVLSASNLTKVYGTDTIITGADFHVNSGDRIGIVGRNGAGKTTLLNLITGEIAPDEGRIYMPSDLRVGYLKQRDDFQGENTLIEEINKIFEPLKELETQINTTADMAAAHPQDLSILHRLDSLQQQYENRGGYTYRSEMTGILNSMAFGPEF